MNDIKRNISIFSSSYNGVVTTGTFLWKPTPPNHIRIGNNMARIDLETGKVELGEGVEPSDAAIAFWKAVYEEYGNLIENMQRKAILEKDKEVQRLKDDIAYLEGTLEKVREIVDAYDV